MPKKRSYTPVSVDPTHRRAKTPEEAAREGFEEDPSLVESTAVVDKDKYEGLEDEDTDWEEDLATGILVDTQHSDGHTYNPEEAWEQGLTYTPPDDPPILPSNDPEGIEVAAGFAPSMLQTNPDVEDLPARVDNNDEDLAEDVYVTLRNTSETADLVDDISISVEDGVVTMEGTVLNEADIALVDEIVSRVEGVVDIENLLEVADV